MKVSASSFNVDLNDLLNRMNHNSAKTYSGKIIQQTRAKLQKLQKNINNTISQTEKEFNGKNSDLTNLVNGNYDKVNKTMLKNYNDLSSQQKKNVINLTDLANGNHQDAVNQINQTWGIMKGTTITIGNQKVKINNASDILRASHLEGKLIAHDMTEQINTVDAARKAMMNNEIAPYVQGQFDKALNNLPATNTYYYPNDNTWPQMPQAGDLCWKSDWNDASGNYVNAKLYEYYNGQGWVEKKTGDPSIYAANINGASLKGGMITGANFESSERGPSGHARFSVDKAGAVYASNFESDLEHKIVTPELNECVYYGYLNDHGDKAGGFKLNNGLLSMKAQVAQSTGLYSWDYQNHMRGETFLEPGYLKLRYLGDLGYVRTDLRAGFLEIAADEWNQNAGARLGYIDGPNGQSSATLWLDGWRMYEAQDGSDALTFRNEMNKGQVKFQGPVNVIGDLAVDNHVKIKGRDVGHRFEKSEQRLSGHDQRLDRHRGELNNHDGRISKNESKLQNHEKWLFSHDDQFDQTRTKLKGFTAQLASDGDTLTDHGRLLDAHGKQIGDHTYRLGKHGELLTSHGKRISDHEQRLISHKSRLDSDDTTLQTHQQWLQSHDNLFNQHKIKLDSFSQDLANKGVTLTQQGQLIGQDGQTLSNHTYWLGQHGEILNEHKQKLSDHDQQFLDKQSQLDNHKGRLDQQKKDINDLNSTVNDRLDIAEGQGGNVAFHDLGGGYFTFHNSISLVNDRHAHNSIAIGGMNGDYTTQLYNDHIYTQDLQAGQSVTIGGGATITCGNDNQIQVNGNPMATRRYVDGRNNVPSNPSFSSITVNGGGGSFSLSSDYSDHIVKDGLAMATQRWVDQYYIDQDDLNADLSGYAKSSDIPSGHIYAKSTIQGWIDDAIANQTCDTNDVDNEIRSMVKRRSLK